MVLSKSMSVGLYLLSTFMVSNNVRVPVDAQRFAALPQANQLSILELVSRTKLDDQVTTILDKSMDQLTDKETSDVTTAASAASKKPTLLAYKMSVSFAC